MQEAFDEGGAERGSVTIVVANAGIGPGVLATADEQWDEVVDVNMKGVFNTGRVAIPSMVENGRGGSIVLTSSTGGMTGSPSNVPGLLGYTAAKHGVLGRMRSWSNYRSEERRVGEEWCRTSRSEWWQLNIKKK